MKFDVVLGNPPYQESGFGANDAYSAPIYPDFMDSAYLVGKKVCLVTPGRFLFNAGATKKSWNEKMLNDDHIKVVDYQSNSAQVFDSTDIKGGVAITYRDEGANFGCIGTFIPFDELKSIADKVCMKDFSPITSMIKNQNKFDLDALYEDYPEAMTIIGSGGKDKRIRSNAFDKLPVFSDSRVSNDALRILGLQNKKRVYKYIRKEYVEWDDRISRYEVLVPAANGSGVLGEVLSKPLVAQPFIGYTQTFISIGSFDLEDDANACLKYIKSKFARIMLGILKITQSGAPSTYEYVPLQNFTENSDIDWSQSISDIDQQLYKKYGLNDEEINFIETYAKEMD